VPAKFEAGTLPIAQAIALGAAIDFVQQVGLDAMHAHEQQLMRYALGEMSNIPGLQVFGPTTSDRGAIIPFVLDGAAAQDVASLLDVHGVCVRHGHHCTMPLHDWLGVPATIRASFGVYNTKSDVDALVAGIHAAREVLKLA
jgi:cysteine desulfurase/selenocysteine lyase